MATQKDLGIYIDLSTARVRELQNQGIIPSPKGAGGYDLDACRLSYIQYLRGIASGKIKNPGTKNHNSEKTRLLTAQADRAELDLKIANGEFIPAALVGDKWNRIASDFKARILSIPGRMIPKVLAAKKPAEIEAAFKLLLNEALAELSGTQTKKATKKATKKKPTSKKKPTAKGKTTDKKPAKRPAKLKPKPEKKKNAKKAKPPGRKK